MATWNIGIDETGTFDCFSAPNPNHPSFVCAVVTRKNEKECVTAMKYCARLVRRPLYSSLRENFCVPLKDVIDNFFHARKISDQSLVNDVMIFVRDNKNRTDFFEKIFISQENTDFVGNPQNYYLNSLYEVLSSIFESKLFSKGDMVNVFIAQRASEVTGYEAPAEIIVNQLYKKYYDLLKKNPQDRDLARINDAISTIITYGYKTTNSVISNSLTNRWMKNPTESFIKKNKQYVIRLNQYHKKLTASIQKFLGLSYPGYTIHVVDQSANKDVFPAMADIAATLVNDYGVSPIKAKKKNLVRGYNIRAFIEDGDFGGAAQLIGELFYDGLSNAKTELTTLFQSIDSKMHDSLWMIITDFCIKKMRERGTDGDSVQMTGDLVAILESLISKYSPSNLVYAQYLKMKGEYAAHSGSIDLLAAKESLKIIESYLQTCENVDEFEKFSDIRHDYLIENVAQVQFNSYDFTTDWLYEILESYKSKMQSNPFFFRGNTNSFFRSDERFIDNRYAVICGTIGQMLAFSGEHDKAIEFFQEDYKHTNFMKFMISSFLAAEYLHKEDLKNAVKWFEKQVEDVTGKKISIGQFVPMANDVKKTDMWLTLNFLRIYALSLKLGKAVVTEKVDFAKWVEFNEGEYPWCLVLKWAAICNIYAGGSKEDTIRLLKASVNVAKSVAMFTINTLALSPQRILQLLGDESGNDFQKDFDILCERCESFKSFAFRNQVFLKVKNSVDIWDMAMMLPFNYA